MEISDIKTRLSIEAVLSHYNLKANNTGMLCCPFHDDKTPSMQIYPKTNTYCCFSSNCEAGTGDVIDFIQLQDKCSKHEAILKAKTLLGMPGITKKENKVPTELSKIGLLTKVFGYFSNALPNSKSAKGYLKTRHLSCEVLEIGYHSGQYHHGVRKDMALIESSVTYGLLKPNPSGGYFVFGKGCICFALKNKSNQITGLYFRNITEKKTQKHYYLKDRAGLYPSYPNARTKKLILTESIIDAATLLQQKEIAANNEVLALYGTNGLTQEHNEALSQLKQLEEIILFFDGDLAGEKAAEKYGKALQFLKVKISKVDTPEGEDINSLLDGHEPAILHQLIKERILFTSIESRVGTDNKSSSEKVTQLDTTNPERIIFKNNCLTCNVWGGIEQGNLSRLRVSLHIKSNDNHYKTFRDDVNLYSHTAVKKLIQNVSETLELSTTEISKTITDLTAQLEQYRMSERSAKIQALKPKSYEMTEQEIKSSEEFLKSKNLVKNTLNLITQSGLVGEQKNGLLLFFLYLSRLQDEPLHAIIFGKSGSGKTYLQKRISECLPEEAVRTITSLTENTLYYSTKNFWKHKLLLIEDLEGVYQAFLPLREFMSNQSISKLTTDKNAKGNNVQKVLTVEGPICVSGATTKASIYEDNANRSFLLHVDESAKHLKAVMDYQRQLKADLINESAQQEAKKTLQNAQRLLHNIRVVNPYAMHLKIPDLVFKKLRTNMHYLKLIEIITFYHQSQRDKQKGKDGKPFIKTEIQDIEVANWLVKDSLLRKSDELSGELRGFFELLKTKVDKENSFYAKDIRKSLRMHPMKLSRYLVSLEKRGYLKRTGGNRQQGFEYQVREWEDYEMLKEGIDILDKKLEELKAKNKQKTSLSQPIHTAFTH